MDSTQPPMQGLGAVLNVNVASAQHHRVSNQTALLPLTFFSRAELDRAAAWIGGWEEVCRLDGAKAAGKLF